jgi:hypothetical protein
MMNKIIEIILPTLLSGGVLYVLFQYLGDKWLTARFSRQIEELKSKQQQEIERLKYRINAILERSNKLHAREMDVLSKVGSLSLMLTLRQLSLQLSFVKHQI